MTTDTFWLKQSMLLAGLFFALFFGSMAMVALAPHWPPFLPFILAGVVLSALWNGFIYAWRWQDMGSGTRYFVQESTKVAIGIGCASAFFVLLSSYAPDTPRPEQWLKMLCLSLLVTSSITLLWRPVRTLLFFITKPWRRI